MPNWNAYKVFANGKRAKSPYTTFDADDGQHFFEVILPTLSEKLQKSKWLILNTEEPQERKAEVRDEEKERFERDKIRILSKLAAKKHPRYADDKVEACLMMCPETDWKWAWCIAEGATLRYLGDVSERFEIRSKAEEWIKIQVGTLRTASAIS